MSTPAWLLRPQPALPPIATSGRRTRGGFLGKTLHGASAVLRQAVFSEEVSTRAGLPQRVDARIKLLTTLWLLIAVGLLHSLPLLVAAYLGTLALSVASRLPVWWFVKRVWLFIPIFTGIVVLPATLSVITEGDLVLRLWTWNGQPEGFTAQGLYSAGLIITRVATSISLAVLLTLTTPWVRLLAALRALGVPRIFVLTIGMAYRYLFLLLDTVDDIYTARKARTLGGQVRSRSERGFVSAGAATVFGKAHRLSEEVHQAMVARGYTGDAQTLQALRLAPLDAAWTVAAVTAGTALLLADQLLR